MIPFNSDKLRLSEQVHNLSYKSESDRAHEAGLYLPLVFELGVPHNLSSIDELYFSAFRCNSSEICPSEFLKITLKK